MAKKKKTQFDESWNLRVITNQLEEMIKNPDEYEHNHILDLVCSHLSSFARKKGMKKQEKHFRDLGKVFQMLDKQKKKKLGRIEVLTDMNGKFKVDKDIEGKRFLEIIDFEKYKGESCDVTHRLDGTVHISCSTVSIDVPKRKFKEYEEQKVKK